jgi:hypothetical protein
MTVVCTLVGASARACFYVNARQAVLCIFAFAGFIASVHTFNRAFYLWAFQSLRITTFAAFYGAGRAKDCLTFLISLAILACERISCIIQALAIAQIGGRCAGTIRHAELSPICVKRTHLKALRAFARLARHLKRLIAVLKCFTVARYVVAIQHVCPFGAVIAVLIDVL